MSEEKLPAGWTEQKVQQVIKRYESQTEDEAASEDEAAFAEPLSAETLRAELIHFSRTEEGREFSLAARAVEKLQEEALRSLYEEIADFRAQFKAS